MKVVTEGVETCEQMTLLKSLGCEFAQGCLFSRPLDPDAVARSLVTLEASCYSLPKESMFQLVASER
jgi:EAL domain-containing protein (putative c-di-GMP-specific phosphodiesterase class I)